MLWDLDGFYSIDFTAKDAKHGPGNNNYLYSAAMIKFYHLHVPFYVFF